MNINISNINFDYIDDDTKEYIKTLNVYSFDGKKIAVEKMDDSLYRFMYSPVLADINCEVYFIPVCLYKFTDKKAINARQKALKEKFNVDKYVDEHLILLGKKKIYVFTKTHYHQEGAAVYLLGILAPDFTENDKDNIESLINKAFNKVHCGVPQFEFYSPKTMIFET